MYTYIYASTHLHIHTYTYDICTYKYTHIQIYKYTCIHTHVHKNTHITYKKITSNLQYKPVIIRLRHMRRAIARARLCTCLKHQRRVKKSTPCLIQKASRYAADRTSKKQHFLSFTFYKTQSSFQKIMCVYFLFRWFRGETCMFLHSLHKGRQTSKEFKKET